jgi:4-hydroxybenzoate polyprenyltransferase
MKNQFRLFIASARPMLWLAIALNTFAFSFLFELDMTRTVYIAGVLCALSSVGFLFNDLTDVKIDKRNNVERWVPNSRYSWGLLWSLIIFSFGLVLLSIPLLGLIGFWMLLGVYVLVFLYSISLKKLFLVGNVVSVICSLSPALLVMAISETSSMAQNKVVGASALVAAGFLLLLSREIRFDQNDVNGDRFGGRLTLPLVFSELAINVIQLSLVVGGVVFLAVAYLTFGGEYAVLAAATVSVATAALFVKAHFSENVWTYTHYTRFAMLLIPISLLAYV